MTQGLGVWGRSLPLLAALLVVMSSGCFGPPEGTARASASVAMKHAKAEFSSSVVLVAIFGAEGANWTGLDEVPWSPDSVADQHFVLAHSDPMIGDGKANIWAYVYTADDRPSSVYVVFVGVEATVIGNDTIETAGLPPYAPLGEFILNSDDALAVTADESVTLRTLLARDDAGVFLGLMRLGPEENPFWFVVVGAGADGASGGLVVVDALTGEARVFDGGSGP